MLKTRNVITFASRWKQHHCHKFLKACCHQLSSPPFEDAYLERERVSEKERGKMDK